MSTWTEVVAQPSNVTMNVRVDERCPSPGWNDGWDEALAEAIDAFVYELCDCGYDVDGHIVTPGPFGQPFLYCEKGEDE